ncbi:protein of unknown function (plasmid) [Azospirillum baldaniorum]|uniref:Uncharacterized protein n=1 Tax=Azospirillum baldaniorum TaxID=1064539 RepID=A0A9P1JV16_9PROT|nr:protein of unknown function [Azospirillum baldaniorum]
MPAVPPPIAIPFALLPHLSAADVARLRAAFAARAMAASTRRALLGDARLFVRWCAQAGHRALPAGPTTRRRGPARASSASAAPRLTRKARAPRFGCRPRLWSRSPRGGWWRPVGRIRSPARRRGRGCSSSAICGAAARASG